MLTRLVIEKRKNKYQAVLHVEKKSYKAIDIEMHLAALLAFSNALRHHRGPEFPMLDLIGAYAAENDLQELCDICAFNIKGNFRGIDGQCENCIHFCNWRRA